MTIAGTILYGKRLQGRVPSDTLSNRYEVIVNIIMSEYFNEPDTQIINDTFNEFNTEFDRDDFNRALPAPWSSAGNGEASIIESELNITNTGAQAAIISNNAGSSNFIAENWYRILGERGAGGSTARVEVYAGGTPLAIGVNVTAEQTAIATFNATAAGNTTRLRDNSIPTAANNRWRAVTWEDVPALDGWIAGVGSFLPRILIEDGQVNMYNTAAAVAVVSKSAGVQGVGLYRVIVDNLSTTVLTTLQINVGTTLYGNEIGSRNIPENTPNGEYGFENPSSQELFVSINMGTANIGGAVRIWDNLRFGKVTALDDWTDTSTGAAIITVQDGRVIMTRGASAADRPSITRSVAVATDTNFVIDFLPEQVNLGSPQVLVGTTSEGFDLYNSADSTTNIGQINIGGFNSGANTTVFVTLRNAANDSTIAYDWAFIQSTFIQNGTFSANDTTGWNVLFAVASFPTGGVLRLTNDAQVSSARARQQPTFVVGRSYIAYIKINGTGGIYSQGAGVSPDGNLGTMYARMDNTNVPGVYSFPFVARAVTDYFILTVASATDGEWGEFDYAVIYEAQLV